nr:hypothetical protein [Tanacetum cinerariifolium]
MPPKPDLFFHTAFIAVETTHLAFTVQLSLAKPAQDISHATRPMAPIIEDWVSDLEDESKLKDPHSAPSFVQTSKHVKPSRHYVQPVEAPILDAKPKPTSSKTNGSGKRKNRKTCFVCRSVDKQHAKPKTPPTLRNYAHRGYNKQHASFTKNQPQKHIVPVAVLLKSKPVSVTATRPVSAVVPKIMVTKPRHAHSLKTKSNLIIRMHKTHSQSSKTSNSSPKVTAAKAQVVSDVKGKKGKWGNPQYALKDKGVIDSGCSRYMTGNMSYFSDFQELNGGYVAFVGNPKGGKILGKGKIKTGKLDFEDVYFLPDESQVLLRVPRENNMYNINLKDTVPSGDLTCLFAKATIDESNLWEFSEPMTPWQNGIAERKNRTLIEAARTMLADSLLPIPFWAEAVNTACYNKEGDVAFDDKEQDAEKPEFAVNLSPSSSAQSGRQDDMTKKKDNGKSHVEYFTGNRDLYVDSKDYSENSSNNVSAAGPIVPTAGQNYSNNTNPISVIGPSNTNTSPTHGKYSLQDASQPPKMLEKEDIAYSDHENVGAEADFNNLKTSITVSPIPTTRTNKDHPVAQIIGDLSSTTQTRSMTRVIRDQGGLLQIFNEEFHICMFACFLSQEEPKRVHQALKDPSYIEAMQEELLQFKMQKVWILVDLPHGKREIGHTQEERIDYEEVFAPVERIEAIRLFLAYAFFMGFMVYQMDVNSVFLYGTIKEEVYVCQPPGLEDPDHPDKVYKVVKALYGLHQAPRACYETLANYLLENGFHRGQIDQTLFIKKQKGDILLVQIYVDDIIFGVTNKDLCKSFEKLMKDKFQISSMGELTFFLGLQVKQKKDGIFINQDKYVAEILKKFGLTKGKSASTPIDIEKPLLKDPDDEDVDVHIYRSMIGSLMYLTSSRPDIMFAFWNTVAVKQFNNVTRLQALVDKKKVVVTETTIRDALHLDDVKGVDCLPNEEIFTALARMGYEKPRVGKGCSGVETPLFEGILVVREPEEQGDVEEHGDVEVQGNDDNVVEEPVIDRIIDESDRDEGAMLMNEGEETEEAKDNANDVQVEGRQANIYHIDIDHATKVLSMQEDEPKIQEVVEVVTTAKLIIKVVDVVSETVSVAAVVQAVVPTAVTETVSAAAVIPTAAPVKVAVPSTRRRRGVVVRDPEEESSVKTPTETKSKDKGKAKENPYVHRYQVMKKTPQTKAQARRNIMVYLKNTAGFRLDYFKGMSYDDIHPIFEAKFNANMEFLLKSKEQLEEEESRAIAIINETPAQKAVKRRRLNEEAEDVEELKQHLEIVPDEDDDVYTEATLLARKVLVVDYHIIHVNNKPRYKIIRADDTHQLYASFITMLKNFDRHDLETLWSIVKESFSTSKPNNFFDEYLLTTLKTMFGRPDGQDNPSVTEDGVTRLKKYSELSSAEAIQADCDVKATNIILQALPSEIYTLVSTHKVAKDLWEWIQMLMQGTSLTKQERECKLYDAFDKFVYQKGETLHDFYLRFSLLFNDMNMYNMKLEQFQVNTKFLNTLLPEWSKFVTDVKLVRDLHTTNVDQLHAYLGQHEYHANEVRLMHERHFNPLALISQHQLNRPTYQHHQQSYHQPQFQQHASTYQSSPYTTSYHTP